MRKLPAFQFYPADWLKDLGIRSLNYFERGVWFEMLCLMHESEDRGKLVLNGRPMTGDQIADLLGLDRDLFKQTLSKLLANGVAKFDPVARVCFNKRMVEDEIARRELHEKRARSGRQGGQAKARNSAKPHETNELTDVANAKQTSSKTSSKTLAKARSSSSSSINKYINDAREDFAFPVAEIVDAFPHLADVLTPAQIGILEAEIRDAEALRRTIEIYQGNYDPMNGRYLPEKVSNFVGVYRSEVKKQSEAINGKDIKPVSGNGRRSNTDKLAGYGAIFERYADDAEAVN